MSGTTEY